MKKIIYLSAALLGMFAFASCDDDNNGVDAGEHDAEFAKIADVFVNKTVIPTYTSLADATEQLVKDLQTFQSSRTDANMKTAGETFLEARAYWEKSEAFLFGAATDFGIDPHIDSWPLDLTGLQTALKNTDQVNAMAGEDGDAYAGNKLGNELLGFHGVEYILFRDGSVRNASEVSDLELTYAIAVAGDLRNRTWQMLIGWAGEDAVAEERVAKVVDDLELPVTPSVSTQSYGENMLNAGKAGSLYASWTSAMEAIIDGCKTIADEVGTSKIGKPHTGEDANYIESPYSHKSIQDFYDNMVSIKNVYYGGLDAESLGSSSDSYSSNSLHGFISSVDSDLDAKIVDAIDNALTKISAMKAPFVSNYTDASAGTAAKACQELDDVLSEAKTCVRK